MDGQIKLTEEEHNNLINLHNKWNELTGIYGTLHYKRKITDLEISAIEDEFAKLEDERFQAIQVIQQKYGVGQVDLETGAFIPDEPK